ncbi:MAG: aldolase [Roseibium sp.]|uniref:HPr kinase/phosphorylase n=1 Tax=Roseibium sp. TaxID=1936156 RepID=UPI002611354C|nr:aldolase [Roseibium sp.]MCV0429034.1 aldolase [Roseibium sp.]
MTTQTVHANCLIVGTRGLLLRAEAGGGKSSLSEILIETAISKGNQGVLVADDQVLLSADRGRVIASAPVTISGKMEVRGFGLVDTPFQARACVHMLVDLVPLETIERLPEDPITRKEIAGHPLPAMTCPENRPDISLRLIRWGFRSLFPGSPDYI